MIFQELIAESPQGKGIHVLFNRPPSLEKGSVQHCVVTKIKTDPKIKSISMSTNITNPFNADQKVNGEIKCALQALITK